VVEGGEVPRIEAEVDADAGVGLVR